LVHFSPSLDLPFKDLLNHSSSLFRLHCNTSQYDVTV
jgi:hypothetical protein